MPTDFGVLLTQLLYDAGKTRKQIAEKIAEKKGSPRSDVEEANITRYVTGTRLPDKETTVYSQMSALFPVLISEHVVTSDKQALELISKMRFKHEHDKTRKHLADSIRGMLEGEVLDLLKKQQELDRPRYFTKWQTPLVGREDDIDIIMTMLEGTQFLTLIGVPGVGKSELAWQIAEQKRINGYNVRFISLENVTNHGDALKIIDDHLRAMDTQEETFIILDDCERIEGIDTLADNLYERLKQLDTLTILATSRTEFSWDLWEVKPLRAPDDIEYEPEQLQNNDAIQLFLQAARRNDETYTLTEQNTWYVVSICIGLDGLPLGLLIAGSSVKRHSEKTLYEMLFDVTIQDICNPLPKGKTKHISLDKLIEVSYKLLREQDQALLRRLAVFAGECHREVAQDICQLDDLPEDKSEFRNLIAALNKQSLVTFREDRVNIAHATIRDYAARKLAQQGEEAARVRLQYINVYTDLVVDVVGNSFSVTSMISSMFNDTTDEEEINRKVRKSYFNGSLNFLAEEKENLEIIWSFIRTTRDSYIEKETTKLLGKDYDTINGEMRNLREQMTLEEDYGVQQTDRSRLYNQMFRMLDNARRELEIRSDCPFRSSLHKWVDLQHLFTLAHTNVTLIRSLLPYIWTNTNIKGIEKSNSIVE